MQEKNENKTERYLILDNGGVLDGFLKIINKPEVQQEIRNNLIARGVQNIEENLRETLYTIKEDNDDLILFDSSQDGYPAVHVFFNGAKVMRALHQLTTKFHYKFVFSSANLEEDQAKLWQQIKAACEKRSIPYPELTAMVVFDEEKYAKHTAIQPEIHRREDYTAICIGQNSANGKEDLRRALACLPGRLDIPNSMVFDDGGSVCRKAAEEGYQVTKVLDSKNDLFNSLQTLIDIENKLILDKDTVAGGGASAGEGASAATAASTGTQSLEQENAAKTADPNSTPESFGRKILFSIGVLAILAISAVVGYYLAPILLGGLAVAAGATIIGGAVALVALGGLSLIRSYLTKSAAATASPLMNNVTTSPSPTSSDLSAESSDHLILGSLQPDNRMPPPAAAAPAPLPLEPGISSSPCKTSDTPKSNPDFQDPPSSSPPNQPL